VILIVSLSSRIARVFYGVFFYFGCIFESLLLINFLYFTYCNIIFCDLYVSLDTTDLLVAANQNLLMNSMFSNLKLLQENISQT
jgi:hypothetical protein